MSDAPASQPRVSLREMVNSDLAILFIHQQDPEATRLAAFPSRDWEAFSVHWANVLENASAINRTILVDGEIAGYVTSWIDHGTRKVGYWLGRQFWGRSVASAALRQFIGQVTIRPLTAYVATHNLPSIRVLEKCGFAHLGPAEEDRSADDVEEVVLELR
jgi:RimJ/RimL family protein N-acetyltransferase